MATAILIKKKIRKGNAFNAFNISDKWIKVAGKVSPPIAITD